MNSDDLFWLALVGVGLYFAYQKGFGAWVGVCPSGYQVVSDMFPTCRNSMVLAGDTLTGLPSRPTTQPPYPLVWGWNGTQWVQVQENL
jgi:hypothetical protein